MARHTSVRQCTAGPSGTRLRPAAPRLTVHRWSTPTVDWLLVSGQLLADTVHAVTTAVHATGARRPATVVVNLRGVTAVDAAGRAECLRELSGLGGQLRVVVLGEDRLHGRPAPVADA